MTVFHRHLNLQHYLSHRLHHISHHQRHQKHLVQLHRLHQQQYITQLYCHIVQVFHFLFLYEWHHHQMQHYIHHFQLHHLHHCIHHLHMKQYNHYQFLLQNQFLQLLHIQQNYYLILLFHLNNHHIHQFRLGLYFLLEHPILPVYMYHYMEQKMIEPHLYIHNSMFDLHYKHRMQLILL